LKKLLWIIWMAFAVACSGKNTPSTLDEWQGTDIAGNIYTWDNLIGNEANVIVLFSPDCPLSQNYTKTINDLKQNFSGQDVHMTVVVPGYFNNDEVNTFKTTYQLDMPIVIDKNNTLINLLDGTITPEVFLFDKTGMMIYTGAIDNWAVDLGQKRQVITAYYLQDAIAATLHHEEVKIKKTEAVGCFIEQIKSEE